MSAATAESPPETFTHPAFFYRGADEYVAGTGSFLREGLTAGEPVAVAVPGANLALLREELGQDAERVHLLDMTQAGRNPGRIIPGVLRAFADAHPDDHVRIIGEPIWAGRSDTEYPACVQHEALINLAFTGRTVTILCPYDLDRLEPAVIADAEATHPLLIDATGERESQSYAPHQVISTYNRPLPPPPTALTRWFDTPTLSPVRWWTVEQAAQLGLTGDRLVDLELAVAEVTTNSVVHGGGSGTLCIWAEDDHVVVDVRDAGHITDPLAGRHPADPRQPGGRGLLIVNYLADLVRIHTTADGTTIRLHHRI